MKKFTSFLVLAMVFLVASASAQQSRVILRSNTNYEVQVDSRTYDNTGTTTITDLTAGRHSVAVYQVVSKGIFGIGKKRNQLSFEQFDLRNNDVLIDVSQNGQVRISENGNYGSNNKRNRNDGNYGSDRDYGNNGGKYGNSEGKGRGHKYGHYKNKNNKNGKGNNKHGDDDDDDDYGKDHRRDND